MMLCDPSSWRVISSTPAINVLGRDIQRHIRQEAQGWWRVLMESTYHATKPKCYWSLLGQLGGKRSSPPPPQHLNRLWGKNPFKLEDDCSSLQQAVYCQSSRTRPDSQGANERHPTPTSCGPPIPTVCGVPYPSTAQGPDRLTLLHCLHIGKHVLSFLMELFNLSVEELRYNPDSEGRESTRPEPLLPPISLLCPAVKILKRILLPSSMASNRGTPPPRPCASFLLGWSLALTSVRPGPSRTIPIVVEISKAFDTISHRLLMETIHCSLLRHNLVRLLLPYLRGRNLRPHACTSSSTHLPARCRWVSHRVCL